MINHWVPGIWNITNQRIFLWLRSPGKILFEAPLENLQVTRLQALTVEKRALELNFSKDRHRARLASHLSDMDEFEEALLRAGIVVAGARIESDQAGSNGRLEPVGQSGIALPLIDQFTDGL